MQSINCITKIAKLFIKSNFTDLKDIAASYNRVSKNYEEVFLKEMHVYNEEMLKNLIINSSDKYIDKEISILDLACGTGFNSNFLSKTFSKSNFTLVDISEGMLNEAKRNCIFKAKFIESDMLSYLKDCDDNSFDIVICAWAIKYQNPREIIKEVSRVLKSHGYFAVIVNLKSTLPEIRKIYPTLVMKNYKDITKLMKELPNPKNENNFKNWFIKNRFLVKKIKFGEHIFKFESANEAIDFVTTTGALAGFDNMINMQSNRVKDNMIDLFNNKEIKTITHKYIWGIFKNDK